MNKCIKKILRLYCPDWSLLRGFLRKKKLKTILSANIPEEEITRGEVLFSEREKIVRRYEKCRAAYMKSLNEKLDEYLEKSVVLKHRKMDQSLRINVLFDCLAYGFMPDEYFVYAFENKTWSEKKEYISDRDKDIISYSLNDIIDMDIFLDKFRTYITFMPYYKRKAICVEKKSDYVKFRDFVKQHDKFVIKNVGLSKGDSVSCIENIKSEAECKTIFLDMIRNGKYIIEELVVQSQIMKKLNEKSVNTVRCMMFVVNNEVRIGPCFLKVGQGNSFVDNGGAGGILVGIDSKTGCLNTNGFDEFLNEYETHPDTGQKFLGFQLPDWKELILISKKISNQVKNINYIGWDFAHTNDGWVIIEGNASGQFIGPQIVWSRGFKKDIAELIDWKFIC